MSGGTELEHTIRIAAPPVVVWAYWTDPMRMCEWWGVDAQLDPRPGGLIQVTLGVGGVMRGRYVELEPPHRLVFTFGWDPVPGAPPVGPESTTVEVLLRPDGDGTLLLLRHNGLPEQALDQHRHGWRHFTSVLESAIARRHAGAEW